MPILNRLSLLAWLCAASFISLGQAAEKSSDNKKADAAFWNSVYAENHVLDIQISIMREAWEAMQPKRPERRQEGGPRVDFGNEFSYAKADINPLSPPPLRSNNPFKALPPKANS